MKRPCLPAGEPALPAPVRPPRRRSRILAGLLSGLLVALAVSTARDPAAAAGRDGEVAPVCKGYRIAQPGTIVSDGALLEFTSYWDSSQYAVSADLSRLDPSATTPVAGTYVGDEAVVSGDSSHVWAAYWFSARLAESIDRQDAAGISVPITAENIASGLGTTNEALQFCMRNDPPQPVATLISGSSARFFTRDDSTFYRVRNGDSLTIETTWRFAVYPFSLEADVSAVDAEFDPDQVYYVLTAEPEPGLQTQRIFYELSENAQAGAAAAYPLRIHARDGGCGRDSVTLLLWVDNEGPAGAPVLDAIPAEVSERELFVYGHLSDTTDVADVLLVLNHEAEYVLETHPAGDSLVFFGTVTLDGGGNHLVAYARDRVGNRSAPSDAAFVTYLYRPEFKQWRMRQPVAFAPDTTAVVPVADGDLIVLWTFWDNRTTYQVTADFGELDTAFSADSVRVARLADQDVAVNEGDSLVTWACYEIEYRLRAENTRADETDIPAPLAAYDPTTGFRTTTESLRFCLLNHPPRHLATHLIGDSARFVERNGDQLFLVRNDGTLYLETTWATDNTTFNPLKIQFDMSRVDQGYVPLLATEWPIDSLSTDSTVTYGVRYDFTPGACCAEGQDPWPLTGTLHAVQRTGCGKDSTVLRFEMDNEPPAEGITFTTRPPEQTIAASVSLAGQAPAEAYDVLLVLEAPGADSTRATSLTPEADGSFSATLDLVGGENLIIAYARDAVGNRSAPSATLTVQRVTAEGVISIPKPFRPGEAFTLENRAGWRAVRLEIYTLTGDRVRRWEAPRGAALYHFAATWDGRNAAGETVRQGPYLLRIETTDLTGASTEEVKALVFQR